MSEAGVELRNNPFSQAEPATLFAFVSTITDRENFDAGGRESLLVEAKFFRGTRRDIENPVRNKWASIIDANFHGFAVFYIGNFDETGQRQSFVRTGQMPWHNFFTQRGGATFEPEKSGLIVPRTSARFIVV